MTFKRLTFVWMALRPIMSQVKSFPGSHFEAFAGCRPSRDRKAKRTSPTGLLNSCHTCLLYSRLARPHGGVLVMT